MDAGAVSADQALGDDLGLDSLGRVELMSLIEQELGVYVDETEVSPTTTVAELEQLVDKRMESGAQETETPTFPKWTLTRWGTAIRGVLHSVLTFPVMSALNGTRVDGLDHLRGLDEPAIYAINHNVTRWDAFLILKILPRGIRRRLTYAAAAEITFASFWKGPMASLFANAFPLYRRFGVRTSLEHMGNLLDAGWSIGIFPEGVQKIGDEILPFQAGTGLLAVECRAPVVPVRISADGRAGLPWRRALQVTVGEPLTFPAGTDYADATAGIEQAVRAL